MSSESSQSEARTATGGPIAEAMRREHAQIQQLWEQTVAALDAEEFNLLHQRAAEFTTALRRYIQIEEATLFPAIEQRLGAAKESPTHAMRLEHRQIEQMLEHMKPLLTVTERWTGIQAVEGQPINPTALLRSHEVKERDILYPLADRLITGADATKLLEQLAPSPSA